MPRIEGMIMLYQYVDFFPYCNELSDITGLSIDLVISIVSKVFKQIQEGKTDSISGFKQIEDELGNQMLFRGIVVPPIDPKTMKKKVC